MGSNGWEAMGWGQWVGCSGWQAVSRWQAIVGRQWLGAMVEREWVGGNGWEAIGGRQCVVAMGSKATDWRRWVVAN